MEKLEIFVVLGVVAVLAGPFLAVKAVSKLRQRRKARSARE